MKRILFLSLLLIVAGIFGCSEESTVNGPQVSNPAQNTEANEDLSVYQEQEMSIHGNTILDIALSDPNFSTLVAVVQFAGFERVLGGKRNVTAFAPTNKAFDELLAALGISAGDLLQDGNQPLVRQILAYHVTRGSKYADDVLSSNRLKMFAREYAYTRVQDQAQIGNGKYGFANITDVDIKASNGVVHVIDKVIVPRKLDLPIANPTILEIASSLDDFSTLVAAVKFVGLEDALANKDQLTAFAPTNEAFGRLLEQLGLTAEELFVEENKPLIKSILLYHLASHPYYASTVVTKEKIKTLAREKAYIKTDNGVQIGNDMNGYANIIATDIDASNGVIHVLDEVIVPTKISKYPSILEIAAGNPDFSILVKAVQFTDLEHELAGKHQRTAFAPTNQAFLDLLDYLGISADDLFQESNKKLVRTILLYHLTDGSYYAADVVAADRLKMKMREYAYIRTDKGAQIGNSKYGFADIIATDIKASNGVVHVLNKVIIPKKVELPSDKPTILEIAASLDDFSILTYAIQFTGMENVFEKRRTVAFAPTNDAFVKLLEKLNITAEDLFVEDNIKLIRKILYYHVAFGEYYAEDIVYKSKIKTHYRKQYAYIRTDNGVQIGNEKYGFANIIKVDIMASNGVIHVLDEVLLPADLEL
jgi:transforming growth factor-beta-induced protein